MSNKRTSVVRRSNTTTKLGVGVSKAGYNLPPVKLPGMTGTKTPAGLTSVKTPGGITGGKSKPSLGGLGYTAASIGTSLARDAIVQNQAVGRRPQPPKIGQYLSTIGGVVGYLDPKTGFFLDLLGNLIDIIPLGDQSDRGTKIEEDREMRGKGTEERAKYDEFRKLFQDAGVTRAKDKMDYLKSINRWEEYLKLLGTTEQEYKYDTGIEKRPGEEDYGMCQPVYGEM